MTSSYKHLFQRALAAAPGRLHFAAHSHHLWPDASYVGQLAAWEDAARFADRKWERVMGEVWPAAQQHVANELHLPDPSSVVFAGNTHDFLIRIASACDSRPLRILTTDGEFHSFRRQVARWVEAGAAELDTVAADDAGTASAIVAQAGRRRYDLILVSQVMFGTGAVVDHLSRIAALARPDGPFVVVDGYHGFMAMPTDLSDIADRIFYMAGGYKYAMAGEGVGILHAPPGFAPRPVVTGWYAEFDDLSLPPGQVGYAPDARRFLGATFDPTALYRFVAVRDMLADEGITTADIAERSARSKKRLLSGLAHTPLADAEIVNPPSDGPQARFLALRSRHAPDWQAALAAQDVVTDVRGDVLRIGFGLYHDDGDVDALLDILETL